MCVDGVGVEVRAGGRGEGGRDDGVRHVRRHAAPVARLPPLARVVQHLGSHNNVNTFSQHLNPPTNIRQQRSLLSISTQVRSIFPYPLKSIGYQCDATEEGSGTTSLIKYNGET